MNSMKVEPLISVLRSQAEVSRKKEVAKALRKFKRLSDEDLTTIDDLTRGIVEAVLDEPISKIRRAAESGDDSTVESAIQLFSLKTTSLEEKTEPKKITGLSS